MVLSRGIIYWRTPAGRSSSLQPTSWMRVRARHSANQQRLSWGRNSSFLPGVAGPPGHYPGSLSTGSCFLFLHGGRYLYWCCLVRGQGVWTERAPTLVPQPIPHQTLRAAPPAPHHPTPPWYLQPWSILGAAHPPIPWKSPHPHMPQNGSF